MDETIRLILIIIGVFIFAFFIEALVIYFFKIKPFWSSFGISIFINIISFFLIFYGIAAFLAKLGYQSQFNGLNMPPQALLFVWWFAVVIEGLILQILLKKADRRKLYLASIIMNTLSFFILGFFVANSH